MVLFVDSSVVERNWFLTFGAPIFSIFVKTQVWRIGNKNLLLLILLLVLLAIRLFILLVLFSCWYQCFIVLLLLILLVLMFSMKLLLFFHFCWKYWCNCCFYWWFCDYCSYWCLYIYTLTLTLFEFIESNNNIPVCRLLLFIVVLRKVILSVCRLFYTGVCQFGMNMFTFFITLKMFLWFDILKDP